MAEGFQADEASDAEKGQGPPQAPPAAGDAGNSFLSQALTALDPMDKASVERFNADAQRIKDLAQAGPAGGGFAIEPGAGQRFIAAITKYVDETWPGMERDVFRLATHPEIGTGDYAKEVADHDLRVMEGDPQSLIPNLDLLATGLRDLREGIEVAMQSYNEKDEQSSLAFKAVDLG
ncbi:hypothetical protein [Amycolatopsis sp. YIM 10]|uniref:hypothetical protein n=1 Tax=Amycolatopsis sp. YIM 10 TaxID=2653857 RepID=UPI00128FD4CF|nr:hypothetical protein [Amycolatopsis sp. YIM 10]QFU93104.1 hypothetical protein YIM_39825 [Amycolatopsis sp. YIM 10]